MDESEEQVAPLGVEPGPAPAPLPPPKRPRLWSVILVAILGMPAALLIAILIMVLYAGFADGFHAITSRSYFDNMMGRPGLVIASIVGMEVGLGAVVIVPALLSREVWYRRLGLVGAGRYWKTLPLLMVATFAINDILSVTLARFLGAPTDYMTPIMTTLYNSGASGRTIMVLSVTVLAGFAEEIVFRGYLQRRFLQRWPVWIAIGVSSVLFAAAHFSPTYAAFVLPLGVWLGVVAWRTGSTWCSIACHLFNNLMAMVILYIGVVTKTNMNVVAKGEVVFAVVAVLIIVWAIRALFREPPAPVPAVETSN